MSDTAPERRAASAVSEIGAPAPRATFANALEDALLASQLDHPERVSRAIDPHDEMFLFAQELTGGDRAAARADYFTQGLRILATIRQLVEWRFGGFAALDAVLDFASGYGRVTRLLATAVPVERIWAADIYTDAMAFQRRELGVHTLASGPRPEDFAAEARFDFILVSSLFSHLPAPRFHGWLARLVGCLSPRGLLAFTVHDESLLPAGRELEPAGIAFDATSESRSLDPAQYGTSWVSEHFVRAALAAIDPGLRCLRLARGHCNFQDLYLVAPAASPPFVGLDFDPGPHGFVERCEVTSRGTVALEGWALEGAEARGAHAVEIVLPGTSARWETASLEARADVATLFGVAAPLDAGFRCELPLPADADPLACPVLVQARSRRGVRTVLAAGSLAGVRIGGLSLLKRCLETDLATARQQLAERDHSLAVARHESAERAARIAAMEASRFWRARDAWFAVKRALRLTDER